MIGPQGIVGILAAGFAVVLTLGNATSGELISSREILDALTAPPTQMSLADRLRLTRSPTYDDRRYDLASAQVMPHIDLDIYFDFDSAVITPQAEPQLRELGMTLVDPILKVATISINGHTDAVGGDVYNKRLSERRAAAIKEYLVENFQLSSSNLRTYGYGKAGLKNKADPYADENRRVEVVNMTPQMQAARR